MPVVKGKKKWTVTGPATTGAIVRVVLNQDASVFGVMSGTITIEHR